MLAQVDIAETDTRARSAGAERLCVVTRAVRPVDEMIRFAYERYGEDRVAQIITFGTLGAKAVVRDVGRVMGLTFGECDRLAKMIPFDLKMTLEKALKQSPELKQAYESEEITHELIDTALILEDLARNASVHAAGVVIAAEPLTQTVPLQQLTRGGEEGTMT